MAEIKNFVSDKSLQIKALNIYSSTGKKVDLSNIYIAVNIYEDIYSSTMSGDASFNDSNDLLSDIPIIGFEYIEFELIKPESPNNILKKVFRIHKVDGPAIDYGSQKNMTYMIKFFSEEFYLSMGTKVSKSYKQKRIDQIVKDLIDKQLFTSKLKSSNFQQSSGLYDIIIPYWTPFRAIEWLTTRAVKAISKNVTYPFFFYENSEGYNFKSIDSMMAAVPLRNYVYEPQNVQLTRYSSEESSPTREIQARKNNIIQFEFINYLDMMKAYMHGMFASSLLTFDPIRLQTNQQIFDYKKQFENSTHLDNKSGRFNNDILDRTKKSITDRFGVVRKYYPTTLGLDSDPIISNMQPNITPNYVESWLLSRISKIEELNYFKVKLLAPGDNVITVGKTITFKMPRIYAKEKGSSDDHPYFTGKYLVTSVRHMITPFKYEMLIEGIKDDVTKSYPTAAINNSDLEKIKRS